MTYYTNGAMMAPLQAAPQFVPQGVIGDGIAWAAPIVGGVVGGATTAVSESPALGGLVGGATTALTKSFGEWLPYQAYPGAPVQYVQAQAPVEQAGFAPQGVFGQTLGRIGGGLVGGLVGGDKGRQIGGQIGGTLGSLMPFQAHPGAPVQYIQAPAEPAGFAPQGINWGSMIKNVGGAVGQTIGGRTGDFITDASSLGQYLPFHAAPGFAPQGALGGLLGQVGGSAVGGWLGGDTGRAVGGTLGGIVGGMLPFQAYPGAPVQYVEAPAETAGFAPQGIIGGTLGSIGGGALGGWLGGKTGNAIGSTIGGAVGALLPFEAYPGAPVQYVQAPVDQAGFAPQGVFGQTLGRIGGGLVGGLIGGDKGRNVGSQIGSTLGGLMPFEAYPGAPVQYVQVPAEQAEFAPQGVFGQTLGRIGGGLVGGLIGGDKGRNIGGQIGGTLGGLMPFQAYPGAPVQYVQAPTTFVQAPSDNTVYH